MKWDSFTPSALVGLTMMGACFSPTYPEGRPCSTDGACPGDLVCAPSSMTCVNSSQASIDAAAPDAKPPDAALDAPAAVPCVEGDQRALDPITGHCYMLLTTESNWANSLTRCADLGPNIHFVSITTAAENALLVESFPGNHWIGAGDAEVEDNFEWTTGEAFVYENWRGGEPSNSSNEDCVSLRVGDNGTWDDRDCGNTETVLCERDAPAE